MLDYEESVQRSNYKQWILNYLKEQGVTYTDWKSIQPLYLRYRARCLKMKPTTERAFRNLCTFKSTRANTKYDDKGELKEGKQKRIKTGEEKDQKRKYSGIQGTGQQARASFKLNYRYWSYLKYALADYEAVKALIEEFENGQHTAAVGDNNHDLLLNYPWLIRYALKCLSGVYPAECFPECLSDYREELQNLLDKQKEAYNKSESETILNDLKSYLERR